MLETGSDQFWLIQEVEQTRTLNETLKKSLQDAQVDLLYAGDQAFERAKAQALGITPDLDVSRMNFFKVVVDGKLVDMEEYSLESERLKDVTIDNRRLDEHEV